MEKNNKDLNIVEHIQQFEHSDYLGDNHRRYPGIKSAVTGIS